MGAHKFKYSPGIYAGGVLILAGLVLQLTAGSIDWGYLKAPVNVMVIALYLALLAAMNKERKKYHVFRWLGSTKAATTSMGWVALVTVVMGLIRQDGADTRPDDILSLHNMLCNWSFALIYIWMTTSLGMAILEAFNHFRPGKIPFLLSHLGLFTALIAGVAGSADESTWEVRAYLDRSTDMATDSEGYSHRLPFSIKLKSFDIREYEPKLMMVDASTFEYVPSGSPASLTLEEGTTLGSLNGWDICVLSVSDSNAFGACTRAGITASRPGHATVSGEVSCGNFMHEPELLTLDDGNCIAMPERGIKSYISEVEINTGLTTAAEKIEVNRPCRIKGWKIYQKNYDHRMGRWSEYSIFEIVHDPWMPVVYIGIFMMLAGAVCMFFRL